MRRLIQCIIKYWPSRANIQSLVNKLINKFCWKHFVEIFFTCSIISKDKGSRINWGSEEDREENFFDRSSENCKKNMMSIMEVEMWHEIGTEVNLWDGKNWFPFKFMFSSMISPKGNQIWSRFMGISQTFPPPTTFLC